MASDLNPHPRLPKPPPPPPDRAPLLFRLLRRPWPPVDVLVVKKADCPLCDQALGLLEASRRRLGLAIRVADITGDPILLGVYGHEVPVVFVAGRRRFFGHVDPVLLDREVLAARRRAAGGRKPL